MKANRYARIVGRGVAMATGLIVLGAVAFEIQTSWLQSELLSSLDREISFDVEAGAHPNAYRPSDGPLNRRLGYVDLDRFIDRLDRRGFDLTRQAGLSPRHRQFVELGGFPIYKEKSQAGLTLLDHKGKPAYAPRFPGRVYPRFDAIPPLMVQTLLFIENRELLSRDAARRNPAVDWSRLAAVLPGLAIQIVDPSARIPGGSTLATQIEKFRYSPMGRTADAGEKLRQMVSASVRSYQDGVDTTDHRRRIVLDYINATPLSARAGFGEVIGMGDGLWAWFGADFDETNRLLSKPVANVFERADKARAYKRVLALLIAQRRPSFFLVDGRAELAKLCDRHLRLLMREGVIDPMLGETALGVELGFRDEPPGMITASHQDQKATTAIRTELLRLLGVSNLYQLDRLDLTVESSIDIPTQRQVAEILRSLRDPKAAKKLGLYGHRLLNPAQSNDPLVTSLTVYERGDGVNYLRVQADNLDQPFDVNNGAKLDLGSTAKLRTLITYLEVIADIGRDLADVDRKTLKRIAADGPDRLTRWVASTWASNADHSIDALLDAAMAKRYSASPAERFFTGGGLHQFANFNKKDNRRVVTVARAMRHSINLPLIRMMRDIVDYHIAKIGRDVLADPEHPDRARYLQSFADKEAATFLRRFHGELAGLDGDQALARLAGQIRPTKKRLAALFRFVRPDATEADLAAFIDARYGGARLSPRKITDLFKAYAPDRFSLADQAYLIRVHPLKLWLARYLQTHDKPGRAEILAASSEARAASSAWLFKTKRKYVQDRRIKQMLEEEAFRRIHQAWARLGYPFPSLVPSYATAIGSSADRPEALATLVGIILNDGVWQPAVRIQSLHFAKGTPYETRLERRKAASRQVLAPEIAKVVRRTMVDVVENGTARRLAGRFDHPDGGSVQVGAKTGTGDHRKKTFDRHGRLLTSEVVNRTATVVFFIGDRLFGNLTIYVPGPKAANYSFTSSLPAQLLGALAPALRPLMDDGELLTVDADAKARPPAGGA